MMTKKCFHYVMIFFACSLSIAVYGESYEQKIAAKLIEGKSPEEVLQLQAQGVAFIGLYEQARLSRPQGAVILLHHMGGHPDWPQIIRPLRTRLPESGWATLSIQMPVLSPGEPLADYGKTLDLASARIDASLQYLLAERYGNIVLVGYSFGAALIANYLATKKKSGIKAFVGISMQTHAFLNPRLELPRHLEKIAIPILDIYGSRDFEAVLMQSGERTLRAKKAGNRYYRRFVITGADHYFAGLEDVLIRQIRGWLDKAAPGVQIRADEEFESDAGLETQESN